MQINWAIELQNIEKRIKKEENQRYSSGFELAIGFQAAMEMDALPQQTKGHYLIITSLLLSSLD